ncbi:potassium channel family protein [Phascolarctobacterium sp.]|uniref:potassium channel family protein n=1 Tax=Phascolarctobacterium sp. TaxID=2049039 RepID=UPI0015A8C51E|nr:potassium channel family protein [uncultured Phascolarctobacterium sp.]
MRKEMSKMVDVFGLKRWYQRLLAENFYKFLVSLGLLACAPLIASVVFDYIVIDGDGRFKASILLGFVLLLLFLLLSFISIAIWAAINSKATGQRRMVLIISAYLMIWLAFGNLYYFFSDTENFVATNTTSIEGLVKEWDGDMHVTDLQESTVLRNVPHFWELVPVTRDDGKEHFLPRTVNRVNGYLDCLYFSGVSILTIGYGDIVPESRFLKMLVLLQGFLGQFINVVAIGLWLSGVKGSDDLKKE